MYNVYLFALSLLTFGLLVGCSPSNDDEQRFTWQEIAPNLAIIVGESGGNMLISYGEEGTFLIDDHLEENADHLTALIKQKTGSHPRFVINTHLHFDHVGGNKQLTEHGAVIFAHDNVRSVMSQPYELEDFGMKFDAAEQTELPMVTYAKRMHLHLNGDDVEVMYAPNAHTNGDSIIIFKKANVIHTGDLFFNNMFPFIDFSNGGSIEGLIEAVDKLLSLSSDETLIVPGHGELASRENLKDYKKMLQFVRDRVIEVKASGKSKDEMLKDNPMLSLKDKWGNGFLSVDAFWKIIVNAL